MQRTNFVELIKEIKTKGYDKHGQGTIDLVNF